MAFRIEDDGQFRGAVTVLEALLNSGCVSNAQVATNAAIAASKLEHRHRAVYSQESATAAVDGNYVVHVVKGATGTIQAFACGVVVACVGVATIDVDLLKNGVSILTAAVTIDNGDAAYAIVAGTIDTDTLLVDDVLEVSIDETTGGGTQGKGVFAYVDIDEDAA